LDHDDEEDDEEIDELDEDDKNDDDNDDDKVHIVAIRSHKYGRNSVVRCHCCYLKCIHRTIFGIWYVVACI
jgi:hypothetical protein